MHSSLLVQSMGKWWMLKWYDNFLPCLFRKDKLRECQPASSASLVCSFCNQPYCCSICCSHPPVAIHTKTIYPCVSVGKWSMRYYLIPSEDSRILSSSCRTRHVGSLVCTNQPHYFCIFNLLEVVIRPPVAMHARTIYLYASAGKGSMSYQQIATGKLTAC